MLTAATRPTWRGYTFVQLKACAEREWKRRKRVYPGYVLTHRMTRQQADFETDMMRVMVEHFAEMAEREEVVVNRKITEPNQVALITS